jgi:hypothetical protein
LKPYIYKRNVEGIHIINLSKTWEKLMIAARVIAAIPNPKDILVCNIFLLSGSLSRLPSTVSALGRRVRRGAAYRFTQAESTLREPFLSSLLTPRPTISEESGLQVL